jgi:hypothetical protein
MEKLRKENEQLRSQIENLQPINIDKLEYKIQELNIQTVSGALNLGISLNGDGNNMTDLAERIIQDEGVSIDFGTKKEEQINSPLPGNDESHDSTT